MNDIREGDIVVRKSHNKDIIFYVKRIIQTKHSNKAILCGMFERLEVDSKIEDLEKLDRNILKEKIDEENLRINQKIDECLRYKENRHSNQRYKMLTGKILHLDGDKKYSRKSYNFYKRLRLNAVVKNIPEHDQPQEVYGLLKTYNPDILVITGHDAMIKKGRNYNDIYNYRNSIYFIQAVKQARIYDREYRKKTVIFAGACQSYFEALILSGADFASSPARILIDFLDPLIVAEKVATTEKYKFINIDSIARYLRDGKRGIGGIGVNGKMILL